MTVLVSLEETPNFEISIHPEEDGPEGWMDDELVPYVKEQMAAGNDWAWCQVTVTASVGFDQPNHKFTGGAFLGGCSYKSEEDFIEPQFVVYPKGEGEVNKTGYYEDMKREAQENLVTQLEPVAEWLSDEVRKDDWWKCYGIEPSHYDETEVVFGDTVADVILRRTETNAEIIVGRVFFTWRQVGEKKILQADAPRLGLVD